MKILSLTSISMLVFLGQSGVNDAFAGNRVKSKENPENQSRRVNLECGKNQINEAKVNKNGMDTGLLDSEQLLLSAARDKPFEKPPSVSLAWLQSAMVSHGYKGSLTELRGPAQMAAIRVASLADNNYIIASQMAYGIHTRQGVFDKDTSQNMGYFITGLTENSDQSAEVNHTNAMVENSNFYLQQVRPTVKGYARWAVRAYAYDDPVAISASMAGVCMSGATKTELESIGKAIKYSQFNPSRDYEKPPAPFKP